jgi:hypothetical protein
MLNDIFTVVFAIEMFLKAVSAGEYLLPIRISKRVSIV